MVGARKPSAQVPRTSSWSIGFHLKPNLLLRVLPKVLYSEKRVAALKLSSLAPGRSARIGTLSSRYASFTV
ncbi:hypothetical protein D3C75_1099720 [compost metagenome]